MTMIWFHSTYRKAFVAMVQQRSKNNGNCHRMGRVQSFRSELDSHVYVCIVPSSGVVTMSLALILNLCFFLSLCMYIYMYHIKRLFSFAVSQIGHRRVHALPLERDRGMIDRGMIPMMTRVGVGDTFEVCWDTIVHFLLLLTVVSLWNRIVASISMIFLQKKTKGGPAPSPSGHCT